MSTVINVYKTYMFKNKDPVIDELRTIVKEGGQSYRQIAEGSGVSRSAIYAWFHGSTRRPQNAPIEAVARYLGYERKLVRVKSPK